MEKQATFTLLLPLLVLSSAFLAAMAMRGRGKVAMEEGEQTERHQKLFNVLQIVTFPNDPCSTATGANGTCYTTSECAAKGGTNSGTCASGFGVCCTITIGCGATSNENCTYFTASGAASGSCTATICPCGSNICQYNLMTVVQDFGVQQYKHVCGFIAFISLENSLGDIDATVKYDRLRLDFLSFVITGPETASTVVLTQNNGQVVAANGISASVQTQCLTDTFTVTNPGGNTPPTICGTNTGEHMYVDSASGCNDLAFQLGNNANAVTRSWNIKVTQYSCNYPNLAPSGCTQYFFGATTGTVQTFNYQSGNGQHLANQDQSICVRRERGLCRICWAATTTTDFELSGPIATGQISNQLSCCAYGTNGQATLGYDCITIPGAQNSNNLPKQSRYCGRQKIGGGGTRCSNTIPFLVRFMSDAYEISGANTKEAANIDRGFMLGYFMDTNNCI